MKLKTALIGGMFVVFMFNNACLADIYKTRDKNGRWQYTDKPINNQSILVSGGKKKQNDDRGQETAPAIADAKNIQKILTEQYRPGGDIEKASLATVTIKTPISLGSGFFVSNTGYILTNRHVVRPSELHGNKEKDHYFKQQEKIFASQKEKLDREDRILESMRTSMKNYENQIQSANSSDRRRIMQEKLATYRGEYENRFGIFLEYKKNYDSNKKKYDAQRRDFYINKHRTNFTKNFTIVLKNGEELTARLVNVSKKYDLALLKLDHYLTPYIKTSEKRIHQTMKVYAVGSPLGISDSITAGIITGLKKDHIVTDTKILPGNSGGPLLTEDGEAIGINSARIAEQVHAEGFGIAIPMDLANREFSRYLR